MDNVTFSYLIFGIVMAHLLVGVIWLMVKLSKKPEAPAEKLPAERSAEKEPPTPSV